MIRRAALCCALVMVAGCERPAPDPEVVARACEERARAAQGPTGRVTLGANSDTGGFSEVEIGVTSDFLLGRDPNAVYANCVQQRTGAAPVRPPNL